MQECLVEFLIRGYRKIIAKCTFEDFRRWCIRMCRKNIVDVTESSVTAS